MAEVTVAVALATGLIFAAGAMIELHQARTMRPSDVRSAPSNEASHIAGWTGFATIAFFLAGLVRGLPEVALIDLVSLPLLGVAASIAVRHGSGWRFSGWAAGAVVAATAAACALLV